MSQNTFAVSLGTSTLEFQGKDSSSGSYYWTTGVQYYSRFDRYAVKSYNMIFDSITSTGNRASIHFETNIVGQSFDRRYFKFQNGYSLQVSGCALRPSYNPLRLLSSSVSFAETNWTGNSGEQNTTLTIYGDVALGNVPQNTPVQIFCTINTANGEPFFTGTNYANIPKIYFEKNPSSILFSTDDSSASNQTIVNQNNQIISQNQNMINQNSQIINNQNQQIQQEQEGIDNISNQSSSDIDGSTSGQTDSLIGVIIGFINAFSSINATNCNLTLEFPDYAGGSRIVNICSGKERAPRIVEIGSSLLLICVFVPLAYVVIRMIYNEIRSWTNG